jgi:Ca-activated chloride channel family protein
MLRRPTHPRHLPRPRRPPTNRGAGESLRLAAAVAAFADGLRGGTQMQGWHWHDIAAAARASQGTDRWGLRAEFLQLVAAARSQVAASPGHSAAIAD